MLNSYTAPELIEPTNYRSALELLVPGSWEAYKGYVISSPISPKDR